MARLGVVQSINKRMGIYRKGGINGVEAAGHFKSLSGTTSALGGIIMMARSVAGWNCLPAPLLKGRQDLEGRERLSRVVLRWDLVGRMGRLLPQ
jgi:hypothetical protein